ncbi:MAG: hypothetical protein VXY77_04040 [Pseudomonadota bacterium]|nr:hypothetical protein [Pseudomonadota bacterium]
MQKNTHKPVDSAATPDDAVAPEKAKDSVPAQAQATSEAAKAGDSASPVDAKSNANTADDAKPKAEDTKDPKAKAEDTKDPKAKAEDQSAKANDEKKQKLKADFRALEGQIAVTEEDIKKTQVQIDAEEKAEKDAAANEKAQAPGGKESAEEAEAGAKDNGDTKKTPSTVEGLKEKLKKQQEKLAKQKEEASSIISNLEEETYKYTVVRVLWYRLVGRLTYGTIKLAYNTVYGSVVTMYNIASNAANSTWSLAKSAGTRIKEAATQLVGSYTNQYRDYLLLDGSLFPSAVKSTAVAPAGKAETSAGNEKNPAKDKLENDKPEAGQGTTKQPETQSAGQSDEQMTQAGKAAESRVAQSSTEPATATAPVATAS